MSSLDYLILAIITVSAVIGVWRGFAREALSLLVWVAAFWLAIIGSPIVEVYLGGLIEDQALRLAVSFVVLFLTVHICGFILSQLMTRVIKSIGLKGVDRAAGGGFGLARGVVVIAVLVALAELTPMAQEPLWQDSYMVTVMKRGLMWFQSYYPLDSVGDAVAGVGGELF